ncbi:MAG TPA: hypothetical protein VK803_02770 [Steroidobacteraceae bacterium]|nr:hypothetical protein [Steroidobacteraceae bacterium]
MQVKSLWNGFWFSEAPYFDLAVLRLIAVGTQLFYTLDDVFSAINYAYSLPRSVYAPLPLLHALLWPWGLTGPPSAHVVFAIYGLCVVCGFLALAGLLTNISLLLFAVSCLFLQLFLFSFGQYHHPEAILLLALLALSLGPCGKVLSLDSLLRQRRLGPAAPRVPLLTYSGEFAAWPVLFVQCLFPLVYISAAVAKIAYNHYSFDWVNGFTLQYYMIQDNIRKDAPLALWVSQFHTLIFLGQFVVLTYQCTYWAVVPWPKLRWVYLPLGLAFHLANYLILYAPFPQWIALLAAYIPWAAAARQLAASQVAVPARSGQ